MSQGSENYLGAAYAGIVSMCGEPNGAPYVPMVTWAM